ncbi:MAG: hypothetical protein WC526_03690 [Patescibacteria group bacterium]
MTPETPQFTPENEFRSKKPQIESPDKPTKGLMARLAEKFKRQKALTVALGLSTLLHGGIVGYTKRGEIGDFLADKYTVVKRTMKRVNFLPDAGVLLGAPDAGLVEPLKEKYKDKEKIDYGVFFLDAEYAKGGLGKEEVMTAGNYIKQLREKYKVMDSKTKSPDHKLRVIHDILQEKGDYKADSSFLSDLLNKKNCKNNNRCGNCEARLKYTLSLVQGVYPGTEFKMQILKGDPQTNELHIVLLAKIDGQWYSLEDTPKKIKDSDLDGSVVVGVDAFVKNYLGDKVEGRMIVSKERKNKPSKPQIQVKTNTIFNLLPPGMMPTKVYSNRPSPAYITAVKTTFGGAQENVKPQELPTDRDLEVHVISAEDWEKHQKELNKDKSKERKEKQEGSVYKPSPEDVLDAKLTGEFRIYEFDFKTREFKEWSDLFNEVRNVLNKNWGDAINSEGASLKDKGLQIKIVSNLLSSMMESNLVKNYRKAAALDQAMELTYFWEKEDDHLQCVKIIRELLIVLERLNDDLEKIGYNQPSKIDLQPLKDVPLKRLDVYNRNASFDLADLGTGIKNFQDVTLRGKIRNLSRLKEAPNDLHYVSITLENDRLEDLDFLAGKKIERLNIFAKEISNLDSLKKMDIGELSLSLDFANTNIIKIVKDLPLKRLAINFKGITSLESFRGVQLKAESTRLILWKVPEGMDLSPLKHLIESKKLSLRCLDCEIDYENYRIVHPSSK